jgi:DNA-binding response OmpR family regulator
LAATDAGPATAHTSPAPNSRILVIEDDESVQELLALVLSNHHYEVAGAPDGATARQMLKENGPPDLVILDLLLPDIDGLLLCAELRQCLDTAILICSATDRTQDPILGLHLGADDFVRKPFLVEELLARVKALLRRRCTPRPESMATEAPREAAGRKRIGALEIDHARRSAALGGRPLHLTPTEYRILFALASRPDEVLTWEELAEALWGRKDEDLGHSVAGQIRRLRGKLFGGTVPAPSIVAVRGFGYRLVAGS